MSMSKRRPTATNRFALAALGAVLGVVLGYPFASAAAEPAAEAPVIKGSEAVTVVDTSATIRFIIERVEGEDLDVSVFYGKKDGESEEADWAHQTDPVPVADDPSEYSATLENLEPDTQYHCRIRATNPAGTTWSNAVELLTQPKSTPIYRVLLVMVGFVALMVGPFYLGGRLARRFRMPDHGWKIGVVLWSVACGCVVTYTGWPPKLGIDLSGGVILVYELEDPSQEEGPEDEAGPWDDQGIDMDKLISAIELRVNPGGQRQVDIRKYGAKQIEVTIPRADEEQVRRIQEKISSAGTLEFRILANNRDHKLEIEKALESDDRIVWDSEGKEKLAWWVPVEAGREGNFDGYEGIALRRMSFRGKEMQHILVVNDIYNVTGGYLSQSRTGVDQDLRPCVFFTFNTRGGQLFGGLTGENLPDEVQDFSRKLGIVLNGFLYSAPAIRSTIYNRGEITGGFTRAEVEDLVDVLNAGSLPAALKKNPISKLSTGPTLGRDTIERGKYAILLSMAMVLVFMLIYYRFCGIVASLALVTNLVLILGVMIVIRADFTLPGLAGLVLTIGIAVDANVLIFERIREELARDAAMRMAIRNGFGKATSAVVDANFTTLITATVLYAVGTPPIMGFAVTLWLGVVLSMFTALFCSRVVFDIAERRRWITKLRMMRIIGKTRINFLGMRHLAAACSLTLIVIGMVGVYSRGKGLLDIDFTGGESVEVLFKEPQNIAEIRKALSELPDLTVTDVQLLEGEAASVRFVINTSKRIDPEDEAHRGKSSLDVVEDYLHEVFGDKLATNLVTIGNPTTIGEATSRHELPSPNVLALADPSTTPPEESDPDDKPAEKPPIVADVPSAAKPAEKPEAKPAAGGPFAGGTRAELTFDRKVNFDTLTDLVNKELVASGQEGARFDLSNEDYLEGDTASYKTWVIKTKLPREKASAVLNSLKESLENIPFFPSSSSIGGKVAGDMQVTAVYALLISLVGIVGYIWIRFQRVMFGLAAVVALVHDVLITLGVIALSAYVAGPLGFLLIDDFKIGLSVLAAFLTIIGYSLNDTIVVFDRIREVRGKSPGLTADMINTSINQTLARTLLTSVTTLIVVAILYVGGGQGIHAFAFSLLVGVLVGTYSSIFVASPALYWMASKQMASAR